MRFKRSASSDQNFWVAYADLMAGLLFVFILLIGAIVVKYVFMQGDLRAIKTDLDEQKRLGLISGSFCRCAVVEVCHLSIFLSFVCIRVLRRFIYIHKQRQDQVFTTCKICQVVTS